MLGRKKENRESKKGRRGKDKDTQTETERWAHTQIDMNTQLRLYNKLFFKKPKQTLKKKRTLEKSSSTKLTLTQ